MTSLAEMEQRLKELQNAIDEIIQRLPAHSVKPSHIADLFDLEDEYDRLAAAVKALKSTPANKP